MKDYTFAQKAEFIEKMHSQLTEINWDLDQLAAKIEKSGDATKAEANPGLQALRDETTQLMESFQLARQWWSEKIAS